MINMRMMEMQTLRPLPSAFCCHRVTDAVNLAGFQPPGQIARDPDAALAKVLGVAALDGHLLAF